MKLAPGSVTLRPVACTASSFAGIGPAQHPLERDETAFGIPDTDDFKRQVRKGGENRFSKIPDGCSGQRLVDVGIVVGSPLNKSSSDRVRIVTVPGIEVISCNLDSIHLFLLSLPQIYASSRCVEIRYRHRFGAGRCGTCAARTKRGKPHRPLYPSSASLATWKRTSRDSQRTRRPEYLLLL